MGNTSDRDGRAKRTQERRAAVVRMRTEGHSYEAIGEALGISGRAANQHYKAALKQIPAESVEEHRQVEFARLEEMTLALAPRVKKGEFLAVRAAIAVSARRAALLGLDAPQQVAINGQVAVPVSVEEAIAKVYGAVAGRPDADADEGDDGPADTP